MTGWQRLLGSRACGHDPVRQPQGGFRCSRCGKAGANLDDFGFVDEGHVSEEERQRLVASATSAGDTADER